MQSFVCLFVLFTCSVNSCTSGSVIVAKENNVIMIIMIHVCVVSFNTTHDMVLCEL